ncbi:MAG: hypothetical protein K2I72_02070 [Bacilli bacterium]|nr:hypothetical protein [Bacilli bacterium]
MKNKNRIILITCFFVIGFSIGGYFGVQYFLNRDLEKEKESLKEIINQYGVVEKETVATLIAKFNTEIMDSGIKHPARENFIEPSTTEYWYQMTNYIYCYVVALDHTGDKEKDVVSMMAIYYPKEGGDELALEYVKKLIKANQSDLKEKEIDDLLNKAAAISTNHENVQSGKGIAVSFKESEDHYEYQVIRIYK